MASVSACKPKSDPPTTKKRELTFDDEGAPIGATLMFGDHEVGQVIAPPSYDHGRKRLFVRGTVPAAFDSSKDYAGFEIELRTPCGTQRVPLTPVKEEGRANPLLHLDPATAPAKASTRVWTDLPGKPTIAIGEAEAMIERDHRLVIGLDCAAKHSVSVDGEVVDEIEASGEALEGVFVAKDDSTCYEVTVAHFGEAGGSTKTTVLRGQRVYPFPHERIDYRFKPVPKTISVNEGTFGATKVGLNEIDCDAAPKGPAAAPNPEL